MDKGFRTSEVSPLAHALPPVAHPMVRIPSVVRGLAADLLCATDTRIIKIAAEATSGWSVEAEVFAPNPELTVSQRGGIKAILQRNCYRFHFDHDLHMLALEPAEE
jgi:hypothetical protein